MAGTDTALTKPKAIQAPNIAAGSPLAVQGIFLEVLRERFSADNGLPWVWDPDPEETDIQIEVGYSKHKETRGQSPGLFVVRQASVPTTLVSGDRAGVQLQSGRHGFFAHMNITMQIECVSPNAGESQILGDIVQHHILCSADVIEHIFGFHKVEPPLLTEVRPFQQDKEMFNTPVQFQATFPIRWQTTPIGPLLQRLGLHINDAPANVSVNHFSESAMASIRKQQELSDERKTTLPRS